MTSPHANEYALVVILYPAKPRSTTRTILAIVGQSVWKLELPYRHVTRLRNELRWAGEETELKDGYKLTMEAWERIKQKHWLDIPF